MLLRDEQIPDAVKAFRAAYALQPNNVKANYNYGVSLHQNNELDSAADFYWKALEINPNHVNCYYNLGLIYQEKGDLPVAAELYLNATALDPLHVEAQLNYCNIQMALDDLIAAEECYITVLRIDPGYVRCLVNLASLYVNLGDGPYLQRAAELYAAALEIDPANRMAHHGLQALRQPDLAGLVMGDRNRDTSTGGAPVTADPEYVRELFDSYSFHFEKSLAMLNYTSHLLVAELLSQFQPTGGAGAGATVGPMRILDLGDRIIIGSAIAFVSPTIYMSTCIMCVYICMYVGAGTGLFCDAIRNVSAAGGLGSPSPSLAITGVDVSAKMLAKARDKKCYDRIVCADITTFLAGGEGGDVESYAAIVFVDVLVYFGDIRTVLQLACALLLPGGVVVFTTENLSPPSVGVAVDARGGQAMRDDSPHVPPPFALQKSGRFGHRREYIHEVAGQVGLQVRLLQDCVPRSDSGLPVRGLAAVLEKPQHTPMTVGSD